MLHYITLVRFHVYNKIHQFHRGNLEKVGPESRINEEN